MAGGKAGCRTEGAARAVVTAALALGVFVAGARACLWDSDTMRAEAEGLPGIVEIITGRFDRFPPEYFEVRLARVEREVVERPEDLALYDDAGVALDRLGRSTEAIAWMARKLEAIERLEAGGQDVSEHRYRYLANLGTFHVHRWLKGGADREDMADVERSRELIAAAIELNPDAHFGRERYQLLAIEWLLDPPASEEEFGVVSIFDADPSVPEGLGWPKNHLAISGYDDAPDGLGGLIALGDAWQSEIVFQSLRAALGDRGDGFLALLAALRVEELVDGGRDALLDPSQRDRVSSIGESHGIYEQPAEEVRAFYVEAREEAEAWRAARDQYVLDRLERGEHPDTHPEFWGGWVETSSPPAMPNGLLGLNERQVDFLKFAVFVTALVAGVIVTVIVLQGRKKRRAVA